MRAVAFDSHVTNELYEVYGGAELADVAMEAIIWTLSRDPAQGLDVGHGFWSIEHSGGGIWHRLEFYYSFDEKEVWVQGVRRV